MTTTTHDLARSLAAPSPRYDPLAQFGDAPARPPTDVRSAVRTFWAFGLIGAGVGATAWLLVLIHAAVFRPQTVGLLDRLTPSSIAALTITFPAGKVELPPAVMPVIAYVFLILLTSIGGRIAAMMIKQGVSLLRQEPAPEKPESDMALPPLASVA
jgi:hypothetical protein